MHLNEYAHEAMSFRLPSADGTYALFNLAGEVGELMSKEAKLIRDGGNISKHREDVLKELGDVLWCIAAIAQDYRSSLGEVAQINLDKLRSRNSRGVLTGSGDDR